MIAIDTMRLTLATIVARLTVAVPVRLCASGSSANAGTARGAYDREQRGEPQATATFR
jgi:hypothetical protein